MSYTSLTKHLLSLPGRMSRCGWSFVVHLGRQNSEISVEGSGEADKKEDYNQAGHRSLVIDCRSDAFNASLEKSQNSGS